jgi:hypothetical protein
MPVARSLAQDGALDGVTAVVDKEYDGLEVMAQNGRELLSG